MCAERCSVGGVLSLFADVWERGESDLSVVLVIRHGYVILFYTRSPLSLDPLSLAVCSPQGQRVFLLWIRSFSSMMAKAVIKE